ncbi:MAG TPA: adenylate/guanylate cyclase domain-containing protein [Rhizomicrobium sp.]
MSDLVFQDTRPALRVAAIGHRVVAAPGQVAATVRRALAIVRYATEAAWPGADLVLVSPLAQGADRMIVEAGLALGYRLEAVLPGAQPDYEKTFDLSDAAAAVVAFRALLQRAEPPAGYGRHVLDGNLGGESGARDQAFLACADAVTRRADIVLAILSGERLESQTGRSVKDAAARDTPLILIDPGLPDHIRLRRGDKITAPLATDAALSRLARDVAERKAADIPARARAALKTGDFLTAIDLLRKAPLEADLGRQVDNDHALVLALARAGAADLALKAFQERLAPVALDTLPVTVARDVAALEARCLKDLALESGTGLAAAARAYETVYDRFGGYYPLINAATLFLLADEQATAEILARKTLSEVGQAADYWALATRAEALLVLGETQGLQAVMDAIAGLPVTPSDLATTRKQLLAVCAARGLPSGLLDALRPPAVLSYSGPAPEAARLLDEQRPGFAFGSLAGEGDIRIAEAVLARGIELHVVLPYRIEDFIRHKVAPGGAEWVARFQDCIAQARTVSFVLDNDVLVHPCVHDLCGRQAMGMARRHADSLGAAVIRLGEAVGAVPTDCDDVVPRCLLFADVRGFSKLPERNMEVFVSAYLGMLAQAIDRFDGDIDYRATAGDGIFLVFRTPACAAECALAMQQKVRAFEGAPHGIEVDLQLRIAIHYGPVRPVHDPILKRASFAGREIIRAARMEPITPPGEIFVTEQLASALFLAGARAWRCDYVGILPSAKGFGNFRMYTIKRC